MGMSDKGGRPAMVFDALPVYDAGNGTAASPGVF